MSRILTKNRHVQAFVKRLSAELLAGADLKIVAPGTVEPLLPWFKHNYGRVSSSSVLFCMHGRDLMC